MSQAEVRALRAEIGALRLVVEALEERVRELEEDRGCRVEGSEAERISSWTEVSEERSVAAGSAAGFQSARTGGASLPTGSIKVEGTEARLGLAKECGQFLVRALAGDYRQSSGRDRLRLASKVYVVLATFSGERCRPPKVLFSFAEVKQLCKSGPH